MNRTRKERRESSRPYPTRKPVSEPKPAPAPEVVVITNPASQAKLDLISEKQREVEETEKVKQLSNQMGKYFRELADCFKELTAGTTNVGDVLENWDLIFSTMGEMNTNREKPSLVRFKKLEKQ